MRKMKPNCRNREMSRSIAILCLVSEQFSSLLPLCRLTPWIHLNLLLHVLSSLHPSLPSIHVFFSSWQSFCQAAFALTRDQRPAKQKSTANGWSSRFSYILSQNKTWFCFSGGWGGEGESQHSADLRGRKNSNKAQVWCAPASNACLRRWKLQNCVAKISQNILLYLLKPFVNTIMALSSSQKWILYCRLSVEGPSNLLWRCCSGLRSLLLQFYQSNFFLVRRSKKFQFCLTMTWYEKFSGPVCLVVWISLLQRKDENSEHTFTFSSSNWEKSKLIWLDLTRKSPVNMLMLTILIFAMILTIRWDEATARLCRIQDTSAMPTTDTTTTITTTTGTTTTTTAMGNLFVITKRSKKLA